MSEEEATAPLATSSTIKKKAAPAKVKNPPTTMGTMAHPSTAVMVLAAIQELKEKKGSSLAAIKKYLSATYKVDAAKLAPFIRKFLKSSVASGSIVQTKGTFKLVAAKTEPKKKQPTAVKNVTKASATGTPKRKKPVPKKQKLTTDGSAAKKAKKSVSSPKKFKAAVSKPKKTTAASKVKKPSTSLKKK